MCPERTDQRENVVIDTSPGAVFEAFEDGCKTSFERQHAQQVSGDVQLGEVVPDLFAAAQPLDERLHISVATGQEHRIDQLLDQLEGRAESIAALLFVECLDEQIVQPFEQRLMALFALLEGCFFQRIFGECRDGPRGRNVEQLEVFGGLFANVFEGFEVFLGDGDVLDEIVVAGRRAVDRSDEIVDVALKAIDLRLLSTA